MVVDLVAPCTCINKYVSARRQSNKMIYWKQVIISVAVISLQQILCVEAYNTGAGEGVCNSMIPSHPGSPETVPAPYEIIPSATTYVGGDTITVTLKTKQGSNTPFKGFLLEARPFGGANQQYGIFAISGPSQIYTGCSPSGRALTHTDSSDKTSMVFTWTAPAAAVGHLEFVATFVQSYSPNSVFWVKEKSVMITDPTAPAATTTPAPAVPTAVVLPGISVTGCGSIKGCYRVPQDCTDPDCDVLLTWLDEGNSVTFEMMGKTDGWVAMGLSKDKSMGDDDVTDCSVVSNGFKVRNSFNTGRSNDVLEGADTLRGLSAYKGGIENGVVRCEFTKAKAASGDKIFSLSDPYYILIARGLMAGDVKLKHMSAPAVSPAMADFAKKDNLGGSAVDPLIKAHGCLMITAWILCASVAIIMARYMKPMWANNKLCGEKVWFAIHRGLMISTLILTCISFIIIFVKRMGYSTLDGESVAHPILGIIVTALCIANPIMAMFRCHPGDDKRPIFNWAHWAVGTIAHILAVPTIFLGMGIPNAAVYKWITWVLVAWVIIHVAIELTLEIHQCCMHKRNKDKAEEFELRKKNDPQLTDTNAEYSGRGFKMFMLALHAILTFALCAVMVISVGISTSNE